MTVPRENSEGEPKRERADQGRARPAREPERAAGQGQREARSQVGVSGSMRARDVSRAPVTPRHES